MFKSHEFQYVGFTMIHGLALSIGAALLSACTSFPSLRGPASEGSLGHGDLIELTLTQKIDLLGPTENKFTALTTTLVQGGRSLRYQQLDSLRDLQARGFDSSKPYCLVTYVTVHSVAATTKPDNNRVLATGTSLQLSRSHFIAGNDYGDPTNIREIAFENMDEQNHRDFPSGRGPDGYVRRLLCKGNNLTEDSLKAVLGNPAIERKPYPPSATDWKTIPPASLD